MFILTNMKLKKNRYILLLLILFGFNQSEGKEKELGKTSVLIAKSSELFELNARSALIKNINSPYAPMKSVGLADCQWTTGFWADRFKQCSGGMIPDMWNLVNEPEYSHIYESFWVAAGENEGVFRGFLFADVNFYERVVDLSDDAKISDLLIPGDIKLTPEYKKELLGGVTLLKGKAWLKTTQNWNKRLYATIKTEKPAEINVQFIPYYSWNNRGETDMTVWMPMSY